MKHLCATCRVGVHELCAAGLCDCNHPTTATTAPDLQGRSAPNPVAPGAVIGAAGTGRPNPSNTEPPEQPLRGPATTAAH